MAIRFYNEDTSFRFAGKRATARWVADAAAREGFVAGEIAVVFCSPERHIAINRQYLGHDYHTDVITFDYTENKVISGDIFIDPATVGENARAYGTDAATELKRVIIHGALHLMGYGDATPGEQETMRAREDMYLDLLADAK